MNIQELKTVDSPKKATSELDQATILYNIMNKNKLATNPNPTSFKNKFRL